MSDVCWNVKVLASLFLWLALIAALVETGLPLVARWKALRQGKAAPKAREQLSFDGFLDALAKVLTALKDLPAWVAIFLAGLALVWTRSAAAGLCT